MKRIIAASAVLAIGLLAGSASAAPLPNPLEGDACLIAGGEATDGTGSTHCEFTTNAMSPAHGYIGLIPNDFVIWIDSNNSNTVNAGEEILAEVSPSEPGDQASMGGQLDVGGGVKVDVLVMDGCVQAPGCGWVGALLVG